MTLRTQLETDLHEAMRSRNQIVVQTIRMAISAIRNDEIDKGIPLEDPDIQKILMKEIKNRNEAIREAEQAKRADLVAAAENEIAVLKKYLPQSLSQDELESIIRKAIGEAQASTPADMGKVMKLVMPQIQGRASGEAVSAIARKLLETPQND